MPSSLSIFADPAWITPDRIRSLAQGGVLLERQVNRMDMMRAVAYLRRNPAWPLLQLEDPALASLVVNEWPAHLRAPFWYIIADRLLDQKHTWEKWSALRYQRWCVEGPTWVHSKKERFVAKCICLLCGKKFKAKWKDRSVRCPLFRSKDVAQNRHLRKHHKKFLRQVGATWAGHVIWVPRDNGTLQMI